MNILTIRRIIFLLVFVILAGGVLLSEKIKPVGFVTEPVRRIYEYIEGMNENDVVLLNLNYDPGSEAELTPMTRAIARQLFSKGIKFISFTFVARGPTLIENTLDEVAKKMNKQKNKDYVFLGFFPQVVNTIIVMGGDFQKVIAGKKEIQEVDFVKKIRKLSDFKLVIDITPSDTLDYWVVYGVELFRIKLAGGCTGVMGTEYFPYIQTGQLLGIIAGISGAYQYEALVKNPDIAYRRMIPQLFINVFIIILIIVGNVLYFLRK